MHEFPTPYGTANMRYRIGDNPEQPGPALDQGSFLAIAVLSFFTGIGFCFAGMRSKHYWMAIWGGGLSLSSVIYIIYVLAIL